MLSECPLVVRRTKIGCGQSVTEVRCGFANNCLAHANKLPGSVFHIGNEFGIRTPYAHGRIRENGFKSNWHTCCQTIRVGGGYILSLIHISEPTRLLSISYAVF